MNHLSAQPKHLLSWGFNLFDRQQQLITLDLAAIREGGAFNWNGAAYTMKRESWPAGDFLLMNQGETLARAHKPSAFTRSFHVQAGRRRMELKGASPFTRKFVLTDRGAIIGTISPNHPFTRASTLELPDELSIPEQVFIFWLAVLMWRRAAHSDA